MRISVLQLHSDITVLSDDPAAEGLMKRRSRDTDDSGAGSYGKPDKNGLPYGWT